MHIAFILCDLRGGGAQKMVINLANWMVDKGHAVDIVLFNSEGSYRNLISSNVTIYDFKKRRSLYAVGELSKYIKDKSPDILFSALYHVNVISIISQFLSRNKATKIIISERNHVTQYLRSFPFIKRTIWTFLIKRLYGFSDHIVGISNGVSDDLKTFLPEKFHSRIETIYNPVITDMPDVSISDDIPEIFPKNCSTKIITSGRIVPQKDYPTLLNSFSLYLQKDPQAYLVILGTGALETEIKKLSGELNIADHVTFAGFVSEPLSYIKQADIFLMTSAWEGFCNVIVEALYCGLNIVSTNCPSGPSEILKDGQYGLLCPVGDVECIANALEACVSQPFTREKQHKRALDFHVDLIGKQYLQRFEELAA